MYDIVINGVIFYQTADVNRAFELFAAWRGQGHDVSIQFPSLSQQLRAS